MKTQVELVLRSNEIGSGTYFQFYDKFLVAQFGYRAAEKKTDFKVEANSDFYIVSSDSIIAYKLKGEVVKELSKTSIDLPDSVISAFPKGEFEDRYLLIFGGEGSDFTNDERMLSIYFKKGTIVQKRCFIMPIQE